MTNLPDEPVAQSAEQVAARFGQPMEWARYHTNGFHVCVDGRHYTGNAGSGCLVSDPTCDQLARGVMARSAGAS